MPLTALDHTRLAEALVLAHEAIGVSDPNPRVGCIVGHADARVLGRGATQRAGGPHAEIVALRAARAAGHEPRGATAWVTLEPCAHHGRTPPCCDALVDAGIARVVVGIGDPYAGTNGSGIARLRAAGIEVEMADAAFAAAARELNIGFFSRVLRARPWVRLKIAASLDGRTALADGRSQWITGAASRADGHAWRRRASAVLTGIGTVRTDDPRLDVREVPALLQPTLVVVDSRLETPPAARLFDVPDRPVWIYGVMPDEAHDKARAAALAARGATLRTLGAAHGRVDLGALLGELAGRGINELHVEAGARLNAALLDADLVDELLVYLAPKLIGPGRELAALAPLAALDAARALRFVDVQRIGDDLRLVLRPPGRELF
ncbi:MAG TPA: bifunctional diaminohydroxyphosphoribosylaminopyrimidine deaminase/5-amino-6-(5-phosphoribosylamino)uracil reductase RibD [Rubrivivax sp.]|nr:bifunctional diaminohydroxyphosphoribosylaminopyrimidine deaminase/5-amino-6-(5-phosphoribosylamino)uracil reductase RibD [Pseudomonadota bacterium]HPP83150.1 bifunctional diaminohydroxyphosphoribosylaminopyrimidine deaminase/5-amino-6-(5-phosphoribosylamino)uracil reductase RibD [Rubrivivax sp.]